MEKKKTKKKIKKSEAGKGDSPRPRFISKEEWNIRHDYAFGKRKTKPKPINYKKKKKITKKRHNKTSF